MDQFSQPDPVAEVASATMTSSRGESVLNCAQVA